MILIKIIPIQLLVPRNHIQSLTEIGQEI